MPTFGDSLSCYFGSHPDWHLGWWGRKKLKVWKWFQDPEYLKRRDKILLAQAKLRTKRRFKTELLRSDYLLKRVGPPDPAWSGHYLSFPFGASDGIQDPPMEAPTRSDKPSGEA